MAILLNLVKSSFRHLIMLYADKRIFNIIKVNIERNKLQLELMRYRKLF